VGGGVGYFYFIIKGKITLSFASPEKENLYIYIYDVITWRIFYKYSEHNYSPPLAQLTALATGASTRRMHTTDAHRDACAAALANQAALH
jgi:hypothetical protein